MNLHCFRVVLRGSIFSLQLLLNSNFDADLDPALHLDEDPAFTLMQIRIRLPKTMWIRMRNTGKNMFSRECLMLSYVMRFIVQQKINIFYLPFWCGIPGF